MAWLCDCDDGTAEMKKERPRPPQQQQRMQGQAAANQMRAPPSEGELAPEFSRPRPELEGQTESDKPGPEPGNSSSRDTRRSDKDSVKSDETGPRIVKSQSKIISSSSSSTSSTSTTTTERRNRRKSHRKHHPRNSGPCCCPMYEVELIKRTGAEALREKQGHLPGIQPGMQIVNTETVAKRLYMYNNGTRLPEGIQMSPPGELIENQGVSAENSAYDNMQPCGAQPIYQTPYEWPYTQPQRPKLTYPLRNQKAAPAERYMPIQQQQQQQKQQQLYSYGGRPAIVQVSSYEMLPLMESSPPLVSQNVRGPTRMFRPPQKVDSIVFQCMCGHDQGERMSSSTTTTNTSSTTSLTNCSTKTTKISSSSRKKRRKRSTSTSKKKGNKSSTSRTSTKTSQKNSGNKTTTSSTTTKTSQKKDKNKNSASSTAIKVSHKKKEKNSSSSSSSSSSNVATTNSFSTLKKQCKSGFVQVQIHCDTCGQRKTYLVCIACYNLHKITTCKDCKATEVGGYPSQNALVRVAGQMAAYRPALPPPSPPQQTHQSQQQQLQLHRLDDIVGALSNANATLIVCCSSKTMVPLNNADRFHNPDAACGQRPIMTNFVLGIVNPSDIKKNASNSTSTNSTTPSSSSPVKSRSKSQPRSRNAEEQCRGSSLCTCGHDSRTCPVCSERRHMH
ncbi:uncharacterized protein LOC142814299 isoform X2 [Rhipicephalus microplus]|uniref:uncharacterized protein LOC142814299 isoform X2 n=1 Tax=Rhipicephalus microplus TaxID=6941 RepID=UPI003F6D06B3